MCPSRRPAIADSPTSAADFAVDSSATAFDLVELLFASANERLVRDPDANVSVLGEMLRSHHDAATVHYDYWAALDDPYEFPLGAWLRKKDLPQ